MNTNNASQGPTSSNKNNRFILISTLKIHVKISKLQNFVYENLSFHLMELVLECDVGDDVNIKWFEIETLSPGWMKKKLVDS